MLTDTPEQLENQPRVAMIVSARHGSKLLLDSLATLTYQTHREYLIIVALKENQLVADQVKKNFPKVRLVCTEKSDAPVKLWASGVPTGREFGAEFFLLVDADTTVDSHCLETFLEAAVHFPQAEVFRGTFFETGEIRSGKHKVKDRSLTGGGLFIRQEALPPGDLLNETTLMNWQRMALLVSGIHFLRHERPQTRTWNLPEFFSCLVGRWAEAR